MAELEGHLSESTKEIRNRSYNFLTKASRSYASQPSRIHRANRTKPCTVTDNSNMTCDTVFEEKRVGEPTTLVTLNRDGDDAGLALEYRNRVGIV